MQKKYFTLEEAQNVLPEVRKKLIALMKLNKAVQMLNEIQVEYADDFEAVWNEVERNKQYHELSHTFFKLYQELLKTGAMVKDLNTGLIDFYSKFGGRDIFLCYKFGEKKIGFWHPLETGFGGRQSVSMLENKKEV